MWNPPGREGRALGGEQVCIIMLTLVQRVVTTCTLLPVVCKPRECLLSIQVYNDPSVPFLSGNGAKCSLPPLYVCRSGTVLVGVCIPLNSTSHPLLALLGLQMVRVCTVCMCVYCVLCVHVA